MEKDKDTAQGTQKPAKKDKPRPGMTQRIAVFVIFAAVLVYLGVYVYNALVNPFDTATAIAYTAYDGFETDGWVLRDEEIITAREEYVSVSLSEGGRVSAGDTVASAYRSLAAYENSVELASLREQLTQLQYSADSDAATVSAASLDSQIYAGLKRLALMKSGGGLDGLSELSRSMKSVLLRREYLMTGIDGLDVMIADVETKIAALTSQLSAATTPVKAPKSGVYSGALDGLEQTLTPEKVRLMTPSALESAVAQPESVPASAVGKLVYGITWYYAAEVDKEQAERLTGRGSVGLIFDDALDGEFSMSLVSIGTPDEEGNRVVLFSCTEDIGSVARLRNERAMIVFRSYSGLRIPKKALRMNENNEEGVYCISGVRAAFRKITIKWAMDEYYIVAENTSDAKALRAGEEVVVSAKDLYEGKILQ